MGKFLQIPDSKFLNHGKGKNRWADSQLIACAMLDETVTVVSEENLNRNPKRKIAYVCKTLGIPCINLIEFLRDTNVRI